MDSVIMRATSRVCLKFGDNQTVLDGYTDVDMVGDIDSGRFAYRYLMIFVGLLAIETLKNAWHYPQLRQSTLLPQKLRCSG